MFFPSWKVSYFTVLHQYWVCLSHIVLNNKFNKFIFSTFVKIGTGILYTFNCLCRFDYFSIGLERGYLLISTTCESELRSRDVNYVTSLRTRKPGLVSLSQGIVVIPSGYVLDGFPYYLSAPHFSSETGFLCVIQKPSEEKCK